MANKIDIEIDAKVLYKMFELAAYANSLFNSEIAGWGHYSKENGIYKLAPLPKQTVSGAEVDAFPDEILRDQKYDISDLTVQWHSHVNFGCTPSAIDRTQIRESMKLFPYLITIIVNCKHEYTAEVHIKPKQVDLPEHITYEVNLIPYYDNIRVQKLVLKQCSKPKPKPQQQTQYKTTPSESKSFKKEERQRRGWNPTYGTGMYIDNDFYPDTGNFMVKNIVYNPLKNTYEKHHNGEIIVPFQNKPASAENNLELFAPATQSTQDDKYKPPASEADDDDSYYTQADIREIIKRATDLDKLRPNDVTMVRTEAALFIQHTKSSAYCEINEDDCEVYINNVPGEWNEFLEEIGALEPEFWYSPDDCVACKASGKTSQNSKCPICDGTGKKKVVS